MEVEFSNAAKRDMRRLDKQIAHRILVRLLWLAENVNAIMPFSMKGEWAGFFKLMVGDSRALHDVIDEDNGHDSKMNISSLQLS